MKTLRATFSSLLIATLLSGALGADAKATADDKNPAGCDCGKDKDGKVCGVDKDCCCTGQKATKPAKKDDKADKKEEKKDDKK